MDLTEKVARALLPYIASTYEGYPAKWEEELDRDSAIEAARIAIAIVKRHDPHPIISELVRRVIMRKRPFP